MVKETSDSEFKLLKIDFDEFKKLVLKKDAEYITMDAI